MRELSFNEIISVTGGDAGSDALAIGGAIAGGFSVSAGLGALSTATALEGAALAAGLIGTGGVILIVAGLTLVGLSIYSLFE